MNEEYAGCYYWLDGQIDKAKEAFRKAYEQRTSVSAGLCLAMIGDDEKDTARRDEILAELTTKHKDKAPKSLADLQDAHGHGAEPRRKQAARRRRG